MKILPLTCEQAKQIDLVDYLQSLGHRPTQIRPHDYWYLSPLRDERTASFKVNRKLNLWYDFGTGKGGDIIDFGVLYHHCTIPELLQKLRPDNLSFHQHLSHPNIRYGAGENGWLKSTATNAGEAEIISIQKVIAINNIFLCRYLHERRIPPDIANVFCKEIHFTIKDKNYYAIGFKNDAGGYELRSRFFKLSSSPKAPTFLDKNVDAIKVFEGFFSFLSHQTIHNKQAQPLTNFLILNSLSFFEKSCSLMEKHEQIHLFLDRDKAGLLQTQKALKRSRQYIDQSHLYKGHKDMNDWLTGKRMVQKIRLHHGRHL